MDTVTRCIRLQASLKATEQAVRRHFKESRAAQDRLLKQAGILVYLLWPLYLLWLLKQAGLLTMASIPAIDQAGWSALTVHGVTHGSDT